MCGRARGYNILKCVKIYMKIDFFLIGRPAAEPTGSLPPSPISR